MYLIITKCWLQTNKQTQWTRSQIFIQRNYYKKKKFELKHEISIVRKLILFQPYRTSGNICLFVKD